MTDDHDVCAYCGTPVPLEGATLESLERGQDVTGWYVTIHVPDLKLLEWLGL